MDGTIINYNKMKLLNAKDISHSRYYKKYIFDICMHNHSTKICISIKYNSTKTKLMHKTKQQKRKIVINKVNVKIKKQSVYKWYMPLEMSN